MTEQARAGFIETLKHWLGRTTEPAILFPVVAIVVLALIWGMTFNLIRVERAAAEQAITISSRELADTYEAQVLRSLREINQNLLLVKYIFESGNQDTVLEELKERSLMLPDLLFTVSIFDSQGNIVQSTGDPIKDNIAGEDFFEDQREGGDLSIGQPWRTPDSQEWKLQFSRRLNTDDGDFAGVVVVQVDAAYFVSGYESTKLGEQGLLGLLGTDGIFRVRRSGDFTTAGGSMDDANLALGEGSMEASDPVVSMQDGIKRYISVRQLFDLPLAVVVGLSEQEYLAEVRQHQEAYLWRAAGGSIVLLFVIFQLYRLSRELARSRQAAVEEQVAHARQVEYLAFHDGLTGLPNRSLFSKLLAQSINNAKRYNRKLAVLFLDLDRFKQINDTLGHDAGDDLLKEVARRLQSCLRESDTVARMGGDEFVAILPELEEENYSATVARKILAVVAEPFTLAGQEYRVTVSVGISTYPQDGEDEQTLTKHADVAMYQAKQEGKNNFQFYSDKLNANSLERLALDPACVMRWKATNSNCTTRPSVIPATAISPVWKPCCAGTTRTLARWRR